MKKIRIFTSCIIAYSSMLVSCKSTVNQPKKSNVTYEVESTLAKSNVKNKVVNDSVSKILSELPLDVLLTMHKDQTNKDLRGITKKRIEGEIVRRHEISSDLYAKYRDDFWNRNTSYIHPVDYNKLNALLANASSTDYVLFTYTDEKVATDFHYQIVKNHTFNSFVSCFPALLLKQMINDVDYDRITIGKGVKYLETPPYALPPKNYNIAMLKYFDDKGNVQYFDIVEDPSVSSKK